MSKPRGVLIAGNWKMNHGPAETETFFRELAGRFPKRLNPSVTACVIPPTLSLHQAKTCIGELSLPILLGSQNTHWEKKGAFTGEVSGPMLKEIGVEWSLTGHSERRQFFGETDETVRKRTESLLDQGFHVILCIGESGAERKNGETAQVLARQLDGAIPQAGQGAARYLDGRLILAYEPVWAIGTGVNATPEQAEETHKTLRKMLWDRFGMESSGRTPILYGGSVTPDNINALLACPNVDGALVGGASLKPDSYWKLVQAAQALSL